MRRLALSVFTACGFALLTACDSGGGYGFSTGGNGNGSINQVVFFAGLNGQTNSFFLTPGGTSPLEVSAVGESGSGPFALVVPDATFTWAARFVDPASLADASIATYQVGTTGVTKPCPKRPSTTPAIPLYQETPPGIYSAILPPSQAAKQVFVRAPDGMAAADTAAGYCILLVAKHVGDGTLGTKTIIVSNSP